ncbi:helix-turn-helix domain-containing protein [Capnocytophaga canis]|uniref:HTH cro/C1-type domain-containing protein n=1 Tax=Capnocytophaga canis TaxID=1848903 RepID=A0A0B7IPG8_9FLAO|nr:helix-turn-helix domain-containing protein [Capnocytophaga canis]CEN53695.1 hypothetical protein CCAND93_520004 [Capnocytophaga canis]
MNKTKVTLKEETRQELLNNGVALTQVAALIGKSSETVRNWLKKNTENQIRYDFLLAVCQVLDMEMSQILEIEEN